MIGNFSKSGSGAQFSQAAPTGNGTPAFSTMLTKPCGKKSSKTPSHKKHRFSARSSNQRATGQSRGPNTYGDLMIWVLSTTFHNIKPSSWQDGHKILSSRTVLAPQMLHNQVLLIAIKTFLL